jgi:type VI secretion system protein ImpF
MAPPDRQNERLKIPLMFAFRDAYEKRDAKRMEDVRVDGERVISNRNSMRRGTTESVLKQDLGTDLGSLVDTINLGSAIALDELPYVSRSVLNYGLPDLSPITAGTDRVDIIGVNLKAALLRHEPRLNRRSLSVQRNGDDEDSGQRVRFKVHAELISRPLDIPVEFVAEVDVGAGKVFVPRLPGAT